MASEDSDQVVPGFLAIHGLRDLNDLDQPLRIEVPAGGDELHAASERFEVVPLDRPERMLAEEWNDHLHEIRAAIHAVLQEILAMIVLPGVAGDASNPEEPMKVLETDHARSAL